jgi:hypothetical protein
MEIGIGLDGYKLTLKRLMKNFSKYDVNYLFNETNLNIIFFFVILFLVYSTGYVSDDFSEINNVIKNDNSFRILPFNTYINIPVLYYSHFIFYHFFTIENYILFSLVKFGYTFLSFYLTAKFFSIFVNYYQSVLIAFFFIFWPTHDSTVYFFLAQYLMLTISLQLFAYYLLNKNYYKSSIIFSFLGSFISYGSTPVAIGLSFLFLLNKSYKKSLYILIPNLIYVIYYIFISKIFLVSSISRIPDSFNLYILLKNCFLQLATLIDSNIGISFFGKIFFSLGENNLLSLISSLLFFLFLFFFKKKKYLNNFDFNIDKKLLVSLILIIIISLFMFSITGGYYNNTFNLGNRTLIYSSLLISYLFVHIVERKINYFYLIIFVLVVIFGVSNHWKNTQLNQSVIIKNINNNKNLKPFNNGEILFVVGNEYSKFGKFSHIEFFSASHVAESIFGIGDLGNIKIKTLNRSFEFDGKYLKDLKFKNRKFLVNNEIKVYDSNNNKIIIIKNSEIQNYIKNLEKHDRHWVQVQNNKFINKIILKHFPNLNYLF